MKNRILVVLIALISIGVYAQDKNKKLTFEVDGVCEMCKMRIEKAALGVKGVKYANWDLSTHQLSLILNEDKTNSMAVISAIALVGHDTKELKSDDESYDDLHVCCKYREDDSDHNK